MAKKTVKKAIKVPKKAIKKKSTTSPAKSKSNIKNWDSNLVRLPPPLGSGGVSASKHLLSPPNAPKATFQMKNQAKQVASENKHSFKYEVHKCKSESDGEFLVMKCPRVNENNNTLVIQFNEKELNWIKLGCKLKVIFH